MDANGHRIPSDDVVALYVPLGARVRRVKFLVVYNLSVLCILGCEFLDRHASLSNVSSNLFDCATAIKH